MYAERDRKHPTPITTLKDDRNAEFINTNFKELEGFVVDKTSYNVIVGSAFTISTVTFEVPLSDTDYGVFAQPTWNTNISVLQKSATGFMLQYTAPGSTGQSLDWMVTK